MHEHAHTFVARTHTCSLVVASWAILLQTLAHRISQVSAKWQLKAPDPRINRPNQGKKQVNKQFLSVTHHHVVGPAAVTEESTRAGPLAG